ncbi:MAG: hypothetical protein AAGD35_07775 [Actinomycetota bacterium]
MLPTTRRLFVAAVGATPVTLVGASTWGVVGLRTMAIAFLVPGLAALGVLMAADARTRSLVARAVGAGLVATFVYDLLRWSFLIIGWMDRDPIPHIGGNLGLTPGWFFGYLWRFVGNGGGLAMVFFASGARGVAPGTGHGLVVCSGLFGVLVFSPNGQTALFPIDVATVVVAVGGHIIYGSVLGALSTRLLSPGRPDWTRRRERWPVSRRADCPHWGGPSASEAETAP